MSGNEDAAANVAAGQSGEAFPLANCLPAKDGGGTVFPRGAVGRAYHLDEGSFIRYRTLESKRQWNERELEARIYGFKDMRILAFWFAVYLTCTTLIRVVNKTGIASTPFYVAVCILYTGVLLFHSLRAPGWFSSAFPDARRLPFLKRWPQVARLDKARYGLNAFWFRALRVAVPFLLALSATAAREQDAILDIVVTALLGFAALEGLLALAFLFVYLPVRLGRAPTANDLQPIETPARDP